MSDYNMFTREEALGFLRDELGVQDVETRLVSDRRGVLDDIMTGIQTHVPFNNLRLLSTPRDDRRRPTLDEIKHDFLSCIGGVCFNLNTAIFYLLKTFGFDVVLSSGAVGSRDNHVAVFVRNVEKPGDMILADVGMSYPNFRCINVDSEESPVFQDSVLEYKYAKRDGLLFRLHRHGHFGSLPDTVPPYKNDDGWFGVNTIKLNGSPNIEEFYSIFDKLFNYRCQLQDPDISPFHNVIYVTQYPEKRVVVVTEKKVLLENDKGVLESKPLDGESDILDALKRYFPRIPEDIVEKAVLNWQSTKSAENQWSSLS